MAVSSRGESTGSSAPPKRDLRSVSNSRSPTATDWRDIANLGEQIVNAASLAEQCDYIINITSRLVKGDVDVWLDEKIFRLPNIEAGKAFPEQPESPGMKRALKVGQIRTRGRRSQSKTSTASNASSLVILAAQETPY